MHISFNMITIGLIKSIKRNYANKYNNYLNNSFDKGSILEINNYYPHYPLHYLTSPNNQSTYTYLMMLFKKRSS